MMKFFRKHNKKLLAVFMTLLMIVFVGGSALQGLLTPRANRVVADSKYGPISFLDQEAVRGQTELLELLGMNWRRPLGGRAVKPLDELDWILLSREAQALGAAADPAELRASAAADGILSQVEVLARRIRVKPARIHQAMAEYRSVLNTALAVSSAALPSEAEIKRAARGTLEQVRIRTVVVPASALIDNEEEFTDGRREEQLEAHRDKKPGVGLSFGYYMEPALKVQYIKIDRDAIMEAIGIANLERKAKAYYSENRATDAALRKSVEELNVPDPTKDGTIEGPPAPPPTPYLAWEDAREIAIAAVKKEHADEAAGRLADWAVQYEMESWMDAPRGEDGYRTVPKNVATEDFYREIIENVPVSLTFPEALGTVTTEFFTLADADDVPELGAAAFTPDRGLQRSFRSMVARTKALVPIIPKDEGVSRTDYLAPFQSGMYPLRDPETGNRYVFRVVDSIPGHPAESIDEVRERVETDLRLTAAFEAAKKRAHSLMECAKDDGLHEAYEAEEQLAEAIAADDDGAGGFFEPSAFSRLLRFQAASGRAVGGVALDSGVGTIPNDIVDACFALTDAEEKFAVMELRDRASILVVEWVETIRADEDEFNEVRRSLATEMARVRQQVAINEWLDSDRVKARGQLAMVTK